MTSVRALTAIALVVALAGLGGAIVDYRVTLSRLPPYPPGCRVVTEECERERVNQIDAVNARADALESDYRLRSLFYALLVLGTALGLTAVALRRCRTPRDRQRVFANLGAAGVLLGLIVAALAWFADTVTIEPDPLVAVLPSAGMLIVAALGGAIAFSESGKPLWLDEGESPRWRRLARQLPLAGIAFTALTLLLVSIFSGEQPVCGGPDEYAPTPRWTDYVAWAAVGTSIAACVSGLLGLLAGRWVLALIYFVVNPALLVLMILSTCAGY